MTTEHHPEHRRAERLLPAAALITSLGNNIQLIAAALLMVRTQHTMLAVGWLFVAVAVPQALLSPFFGRLADRFDRRRLWIGCDLAGAVAALAVPLWSAAAGPGSAVVYGGNFALAVISALFLPAAAGLIKERVAPAELRHFNALYEIALQTGMLLSAAVGGFALQAFGATPLFVFNAATFLASALCVLAVGRRPDTTARPPATAPAREGTAGPGSAASPGTAQPPLWRLILLYAQGSVVVTVFNALLPVLVIGELHRGAGVVGLADAFGGTGFLLAAVAYRRLGRSVGDLRIAVTGFVVAAVLLVLQPQFGAGALMVLVLLGAFCFGQARIASRTLLMTSVEERRIGRAFGLANAGGLAATVAAMPAVSVLTDRTDTRYGFAALAAASAVAALAAGCLLARRPGPERVRVRAEVTARARRTARRAPAPRRQRVP